jgi:hypothetical protein
MKYGDSLKGGGWLGLFALCFFGSSLSLLAQSNLATISGRLEDPSHAAITGARITVRELASQGDGLFEVANLLPGDYSIDVQTSGFSPLSRSVSSRSGRIWA